MVTHDLVMFHADRAIEIVDLSVNKEEPLVVPWLGLFYGKMISAKLNW